MSSDQGRGQSMSTTSPASSNLTSAGRRQTSDVVCRVCGTEYEFAENAQWCGHPGTSGDASSQTR